MIMPCARVSLPRWNASCSIVPGSRRRLKRAPPSSSSSKASTIRDADIPQSGISPRSSTSVGTSAIPTHTILPSCSRPSRTSPAGGPKGPSLTAAARAGRTFVRAGTESARAEQHRAHRLVPRELALGRPRGDSGSAVDSRFARASPAGPARPPGRTMSAILPPAPCSASLEVKQSWIFGPRSFQRQPRDAGSRRSGSVQAQL